MNVTPMGVIKFSLAFGLLMLVACSSGDSDTTSPEKPGPSFSRPPQAGQLPGPRPSFGPREYVLFESGQVRPLAMLRDGRLAVANTPDNTLELIDTSTSPPQIARVAVGLEPIAVAQAADGTVWVVNHISDSVSIVEILLDPPRVVRTLWVGDEPRDIVFAGADASRAFVSCAHRGQNSPQDPQLETPGVGRADLWVFDINDLGDSPGGEPKHIVNLFCDRAGALTVSADGESVYASAFISGNQTTSLGTGSYPKPGPITSADGVQAPLSGLMLKFDGAHWLNESGVNYDSSVPFELPDYDLFELDAMASPPQIIQRTSGLGTINYNMIRDPRDGAIFVSNTESRNHIRFAGLLGRANTSVRGHIADHRISVVMGDQVQAIDLNPHLDYSRTHGSELEREQSLSTPMGMVIDSVHDLLFVCAFGSAKIGVYSLESLKTGEGVALQQIALSAGGPSAIVLAGEFAYVMTRFDNGISVIDTQTLVEIDHWTLENPEPQSIREGRRFLYDAQYTSSRGNDSCATCHVFGDVDALAWDLGDPNGEVQSIPNTFMPGSDPVRPYQFHPLKGPMTTQSMRGLKGHGPMHWRGDRTGRERSGSETIEEAAFKEFNEAFESLLARESELTTEEMDQFTAFALELTYPPNPIRAFDQNLTPRQEHGRQLFEAGVVRQNTGQLEVCIDCHAIDPQRGLFGTTGLMSDNGQSGEKNFKVPHFRDYYQKQGMFGWSFNQNPIRGPQVRGFGYNHNGSTSGNYVLADLGIPAEEVSALRNFLFTFPSDMAPIVGQQVTLTLERQATDRLDLMISRAQMVDPVPECDLIAFGVYGDLKTSFLFVDGKWRSDDVDKPEWETSALLAALQQSGDVISFTCVPWGSGSRMTAIQL